MSAARIATSRRRRWWWAVAGIAVVLVVAHTVAWLVVTGWIMAGLPAFAAQAAGDGWQLDAGAGQRTGWPFAASVRLPHVAATRALGEASLRWTADDVLLTIAAIEPGELQVLAPGGQTLGFGAEAPLPLRAGVAMLRVPFSGAPVTIELRDVVTTRAGRELRVGHLTGSIAALATAFTADGVRLSPALPAPFDGGLAVSARIVASQAFPDTATPAQSAAAWQAAGGRIDVPAMTLEWGPLRVTGIANGGLDPRLQPFGRANLQAQGAAEVLDAAARGGLVPAAPASAARAVLQLLALATQGGPVALPVGLVDRTLTVARFPLLRLPMLDWASP